MFINYVSKIGNKLSAATCTYIPFLFFSFDFSPPDVRKLSRVMSASLRQSACLRATCEPARAGLQFAIAFIHGYMHCPPD